MIAGLRAVQERVFPMAIQFHCPGCSQPIEVDDVYAGQTAACPYCRRVVSVPLESTLGGEATAPARPAVGCWPGTGGTPAAPPPPPGAPLPGEADLVATDRTRTARALGNWALICTVLAVLLLAGTVIYNLALLLPHIDPEASQPTAELAKLNVEIAQRHPALTIMSLGAMFAALAGLALGITSLRLRGQGNWRGIVAVVVCGMLVTCFCISTAAQLAV